MFDYKQRETTDEYREGWDKIWGDKKKLSTEKEEEICGKMQSKECLN